MHLHVCSLTMIHPKHSPYGLGAILTHKVGDDELPIALASRSLALAEKNYSQIDMLLFLV